MIPLASIKKEYYFLLLGYIAQGLSYVAIILIPSLFFLPKEIGVLGICFSLQYILSQFFGLGLHFSALYHKSLDSTSAEKIFCSTTAHLIVTIVASCLGMLTFFVAPLLLSFYHYFDLEQFKTVIIVSSVIFAINKVYLSELNALKHYVFIGKLYLIKSVLYFSIIWLLVSKAIAFDHYVGLQLLIPELFVYLLYGIAVLKNYRNHKEILLQKYFKRDVLFGLKSFWGTLFYEASTKVDLLLLGAFVHPAKVGVFTIVSMISDLFLNLCTVLRTLVNPDITQSFISDKPHFSHFIKKKARENYLILIPVLVLFVLGYYIAVSYLPYFSNYSDGFIPLTILAGFLALTSGYIPLMLTFGQIGKPNFQSVNFLILCVSNVLLNYLLIPRFELIGAAAATGFSYVIYVLFFKKVLDYVIREKDAIN